jgi:hypothetical protein
LKIVITQKSVTVKINRESWGFFWLGVFVLLTRLPFIFNGFGVDGDSWSVALSAKALNSSGAYIPSRFPGYPVHEFLCSLLINFGAIGTNMISAIFSAVAVVFFAMILRFLRFRMVIPASIAFAMVPVFFINSTTTIDYVIAIAFILMSLYHLLRQRLYVAGILLGFAIGTRITSGAMFIPFSILLLTNEGVVENLRRILRFVIPGIITGIILFLPLLSKYGLSFLTFYNFPYPSISKVLYKFSIEVWGVAGFAGLIISIGLLFLPDRITAKKFLFPRGVNEKFVISWLVAIDLYIIAYLKLPMEGGYLIPIIPFVIMLFGKYLYSKAFIFFTIMIIVSSFICGIFPVDRYDFVQSSPASVKFNSSGETIVLDFFKGPLIGYNERRKNGIKFVDGLLSSTDTINSKSVLVAGRWFNQMVVQSKDTSAMKIVLRNYISEPEADYFYAKGYKIYFLPKQDLYNKIMRNNDLTIYSAIPYLKAE